MVREQVLNGKNGGNESNPSEKTVPMTDGRYKGTVDRIFNSHHMP